jgi:hypothetical protein
VGCGVSLALELTFYTGVQGRIHLQLGAVAGLAERSRQKSFSKVSLPIFAYGAFRSISGSEGLPVESPPNGPAFPLHTETGPALTAHWIAIETVRPDGVRQRFTAVDRGG